MQKNRYASDLSDSQWAIIGPLFPRAGNRSKWEKRELVGAVLYFVDNGCKWRNLPHDFPPYTTVAIFYYAAIRSKLWEKIRAALVERVRTESGRNADPSYAIIDSQSVKTASSGEERGIDGGKNKLTLLIYHFSTKKHFYRQKFFAVQKVRQYKMTPQS